MANSPELASVGRKASSAANETVASAAEDVSAAASGASADLREKQLEEQISQLQSDLKNIASTLAKLSGDKVNEVKHVAKSEALQLQRHGQNVLDDVQLQAGEFEQQLKNKIREKPITAVASALGVGYILALLSRH